MNTLISLRTLYRHVEHAMIGVQFGDKSNLSVEEYQTLLLLILKEIDSLNEPTGNLASPNRPYRSNGETRGCDSSELGEL